jgi:hypothetical protein
LIRYRFLIVLHTDKVSPFSLGMLFKYRQEAYTKRAPGGMKKGNLFGFTAVLSPVFGFLPL